MSLYPKRGTRIADSVASTSIAADGAVGVVTTSYGIRLRNPGAAWQEIPGRARAIAVVGRDRFYAIGTDESVYRWTGTELRAVGRRAKHVAARADGSVVVVHSVDGTLWSKPGYDDLQNWTRIPGVRDAERVAVTGGAGSIYFSNRDRFVYRSDGAAVPRRVGPMALDLSAAADGTVVIAGLDRQVLVKAADDFQAVWFPVDGARGESLAVRNGSGGVVVDDLGDLYLIDD